MYRGRRAHTHTSMCDDGEKAKTAGATFFDVRQNAFAFWSWGMVLRSELRGEAAHNQAIHARGERRRILWDFAVEDLRLLQEKR